MRAISEIEARLKAIGQLADGDVPVAETMMLMGAMDRDVTDLSPYRDHLAQMHAALVRSIDANPKQDTDDLLQWRLARLKDVLFTGFGYQGDPDHAAFSDPDKINFLDVLTERSGLPVALGALFYELAKAQGWTIAGLNFPGHFIMRLEAGPLRLIFDPFHEGKILDAASMRGLLKDSLGAQAELSHDYYNPVTPRTIVLRFCNNRKIRFLQQGNYEAAMDMVRHELWIAPNEPLLYFDGGVLAVKLDMYGQALTYLTEFIDRSDDKKSIAEAKAMILSLQRELQ